jgi:hypothetical protein
MTSVSLSATTKLTATSDTGVAVTVNGNAELASLTLGMNSVDDLSISLNPKLATLAGATALTGNGTSTTVDVDIHQNAFVASSIKDTEEEIALASTAVGGTTDLGTITTTSGLKDLDAYITDAIAATGTVSVWFDTVTKLETQAAFGGTYTDVTADLTAPTAWDDTTAADNADNFSGGYQGYYAYAFSRDGSDAVTATSGARLTENITYTFDTGKAAASYADTALATNEGITIAYTGGNTTFKQGDTYNGSTVATLDDLVAYINADTSLDGLGINLVADRAGYEKTLMTLNYTVSGDNGASNTTGTLSTVGDIWYTVNTTETGASSYISTTVANALGGTTSSIRTGLVQALNAHNFGAVKGTNDNQIIVTRMISGGTSTDKSGLSSIVNVTPFIDDAQTSTTAKFLTGNVSNNAAKTSGNFAFTVTEEEISGIRITLRNTGSVAFSSAVSLYGAAASNTAILTAGDGEGTVTDGEAKPNGTDRLLVSGTNVAAWTATYTAPGDLVTDYGDIAAGTTTTTTAAVTEVTTNRTGW